MDIDKFLETWKQKMETPKAILNKTMQMVVRVNKKREHIFFSKGPRACKCIKFSIAREINAKVQLQVLSSVCQ